MRRSTISIVMAILAVVVATSAIWRASVISWMPLIAVAIGLLVPITMFARAAPAKRAVGLPLVRATRRCAVTSATHRHLRRARVLGGLSPQLRVSVCFSLLTRGGASTA